MKNYKYLIIGGGMTADSAAKGIRAIDPEGSIGLISMELDPPYDRPPLSKGLWKGKPLDSIWRKTESKHVELHLGRKIVSLDADGSSVRDDQGQEYHAEKLLLATGGTPHHLPFGGEDIIYYRTLEDYRRLAQLSEQNQNFAIICERTSENKMADRVELYRVIVYKNRIKKHIRSFFGENTKAAINESRTIN